MHLQQMTPVIFNPSMGTCSETVVGIDRSFPNMFLVQRAATQAAAAG